MLKIRATSHPCPWPRVDNLDFVRATAGTHVVGEILLQLALLSPNGRNHGVCYSTFEHVTLSRFYSGYHSLLDIFDFSCAS